MPPGRTAAVHASNRRRKAAKKARANKAKPNAPLLCPRDQVCVLLTRVLRCDEKTAKYIIAFSQFGELSKDSLCLWSSLEWVCCFRV